MMNRKEKGILFAITLISFSIFTGNVVLACDGPCIPGSPTQTGPQIYGNPVGGTFAMPMTYSSSNEAPYSAPVPKIDYSGTFTSPGLPTIYGNNGAAIISNTNTTSPTSNTSQNAGNESIFGNLFGNKKTFDSQEKVSTTNDLTVALNTKGLALGSSSGSLCTKDEIEYLVLFKNITKGTLSNVAVRMYLPDEVVFKQTSMGNYSAYDHSVTAFLGTLQVNQSGQFIVTGSVVKNEITSVARAEMVSTKIDGAQDMVVSYAFQNDQGCNDRNSNLAGFAGGSGFFPTTLFGWLILSIILCAVIYFARFFRKKRLEETHGHHPVIAH